MVKHKYKKSTAANYSSSLLRFERWLKEKGFSEVDDEVVAEYITEYQFGTEENPKNAAQSSVKAQVNAIAFKFLVVEGRTDIAMPYIAIKEMRNPHKAFSKVELDQVFAFAAKSSKMELLCLMLYDMAGRVQDIHELQWSSIKQLT